MKTNTIVELPLEQIIEDPNQPREEFDLSTLKELAQTIKERKVKSPISVRKKGNKYIINHGARRFRASKLAGSKTIPAYLDNNYNQADQIIENLHRDNFTPKEISKYIGRELEQGKSKAQIAKEIGKSKAFVTQYSTLLDLPEPVAEIFESGRCKNVTLINDITTLYRKYPKDLTVWLAEKKNTLTKHNVLLLRDYLQQKNNKEHESTEAKTEGYFFDYTLPEDSKNQRKKKKKTRRTDISLLSKKENDDVQKILDQYFLKGKTSEDVIQILVKGLISQDFSTMGRGILNLIAFMEGVQKKDKVSLSECIKKIEKIKTSN